MRRSFAIAIAALLALLLFVSCSEDAARPASVRLSPSVEKGLSTASEAEISAYRYQATNLSDDSNAIGSTDGFKALGTDRSEPMPIGLLSQGLWRFDVQGVNAKGTIIATGSTEQYLNAGSDNIVPVLLVTDRTIGTGTVSFSIASDAVSADTMALLVRHRAVGEEEYRSASTGWSVSYSASKAEVVVSGSIENLASGFHEMHFILMDDGVYIGGESVVAQVVASSETKIEGTVLPAKQMEDSLDIDSPGFISGSIGDDRKIHLDESAVLVWTDSEKATVTPDSFVWAVDGTFQSVTEGTFTYKGDDYGEHQICVIALKKVDGREREIGSATAKVNVVRRLADITFDAGEGLFPDGSHVVTISQDTYEDPKVPQIPYRAGYAFAGWYKGTTQVVSADNTIEGEKFRGEGSWTLEAHWNKVQYDLTVVWGEDVSGRPERETKAVTLGDSLSGYIAPDSSMVRDGYAFGGFWTEENGRGTRLHDTDSYVWTGDMEIYAYWSYRDITVSFVLDVGSSAYKTTTVAKDLPYGMLPTPMRQGKVFKGWVASSSQVNDSNAPRVTSDTIVTTPTDHSLWASWGEGDIVVTFDTALAQSELSGAKDIVKKAHGSTIRVALGTEYGALPFDGEDKGSFRAGFEFLGWYDGELPVVARSVVMKMENHTLTARWRGVEVTVSFDSAGGGSCQSITARYGSAYGDLPIPQRVGYTFMGWTYGGASVTKDSIVSVASDHALTATWKAVETKVSFEAEGGVVNPSSGTIAYGAKYSTIINGSTTIGLPTPTKTGYVFQGWALGSTDTTAITGDTVCTSYADHYLYALWRPTTATLSMMRNFDATDSTVVERRIVTFGSAYGSLPEPERTGWTFMGWYTSRSGGSRATSATIHSKVGDVSIYAQWSVLSLNITLDANGGRYKGQNPISREYGSTYGSIQNPEARTGYTFSGWTLEGEGIDGSTKVTMTVDHVLKASWTAGTYSVSFDSRGGSTCEGRAVRYDGVYGDLPIPTREGYTFLGWFEDDTWAVEVQGGTTVKKAYDHALVARWQAKPITVTYDWGDATRTVVLEYGSTYGAFPTPEKDGYGIEGWYREKTYENKVQETDAILGVSHTLYAKWISVSYRWHLDAAAGLERFWRVSELPGSAASNAYYSVSGTVDGFEAIELRRSTGGSFARWSGSGNSSWTEDVAQDLEIHAQAETVTWSGVFTCRTCDGKGYYYTTCSLCGGSGSRTCSSCGGSGDVVCSRCGGSGSYTETVIVDYEEKTSTRWETCPVCQGRGTVKDTDEDGNPVEIECVCDGGQYEVEVTEKTPIYGEETFSCSTTETCSSCGGSGSVSCDTTERVSCDKQRTCYKDTTGSVKITIDGEGVIDTTTSQTVKRSVTAGQRFSVTTTVATSPSGYPTRHATKQGNWWSVKDNGYGGSRTTLIAKDGSCRSLDSAEYFSTKISLVANGSFYTNSSMQGYFYYPGWIYRDTIVEGSVLKTEQVSDGNLAGSGTCSKTDSEGSFQSESVTAVTWSSSEIYALGDGIVQWKVGEPAKSFKVDFSK